ncbi:MAG: hypothetical protein Q8L93_02605 [Rhodocyclaceae bacterium]|nr:hypothetical protein [Rhodocyclaceae bacterium]MDP1957984.1 hypothetical protein [Rhodocyclaceae bacterium]
MRTQQIARSLIIVAALATLAACSSYAARPPAVAMVSGGVLTGANGMTLYTFDNDVANSGKSVCNGPCATNWPPLFAMDGDAAAGDYAIVVRDDGKK